MKCFKKLRTVSVQTKAITDCTKHLTMGFGVYQSYVCFAFINQRFLTGYFQSDGVRILCTSFNAA